MPSDTSVDMAPPASRRLAQPLTIEGLADRLDDLESRLDTRDSGEHQLAEEVDKLRGDIRSLSAAVKDLSDMAKALVESQKKLTEVIGESPDPATGADGSGMKKQLTDLVTKSKAPTIATYVTSAGMGAYAIYQGAKALGLIH